MRDSQRSKVYRAEREAFGYTSHDGGGMDWKDVLACVAKVEGSAYVRRKYRTSTPIKVFKGRSGGRAMNFHIERDAWGSGTGHHGRIITLGVWARRESVILHEIAHHYAGLHKQHGWEFCAVYLDLVRHFMGKDAHDALKDAYKRHKVRHSAPRKRQPLTPEQREAAAARLALAREAKRAKQEAAA